MRFKVSVMKDLLAAARTCFLSKTAHLAKLSLARDAPRRQNRDSNAASDKRALFFVSLEAGSLSTPPRENAVLSCMYIGDENFGVEKI